LREKTSTNEKFKLWLAIENVIIYNESNSRIVTGKQAKPESNKLIEKAVLLWVHLVRVFSFYY